jgi:hypothetical protein
LIRKRVALLDPQKIGVGMSVFVAVRTDQHNAEWLPVWLLICRKLSNFTG